MCRTPIRPLTKIRPIRSLPLLIFPTIGGKLSASMSGRALLTLGLVMVALGNAASAATVLAGLGYGAAAIGMLITGSGAGLLNRETAKAQISAVPPDRAGMASGIASTTRFVGITMGLAGLGAGLAAISENRLRRLGMPLVQNQVIDWHALSLRIEGGDANGGLSLLSPRIGPQSSPWCTRAWRQASGRHSPAWLSRRSRAH
jgi:hypothetical protein